MINHMTVPEILSQYESRLGDLHSGIAQLRLPYALTAAILLIAIGLFLLLSLYAMRMQISYLWPSLPALAAAASAWRIQQYRHTRSRWWRLTRFYERCVQRVQGNWAGSGVTGDEFADSNHVYAADLQVLGEGSLFELLCTARTSVGQRGLAGYLLEAPSLHETRLRKMPCASCASGRMCVRGLRPWASSSTSNRNGAPSSNGWRPRRFPSHGRSPYWR